MHRNLAILCTAAAAALIAFTATTSVAAGDDVIEQAMKKYHKAPKGTDPTCKKITNGQATDAELADVLKAYQAMCGAKPPKGEVGPWQDKCKALIAAIKSIQAKDAGGVDAYKKAVNCKACHSEHKPD